MYYKGEIQRLKNAARLQEQAVKALDKRFKDSVVFTCKFLAICKNLGIKKVAIGMTHKSIKSSVNWPFNSDTSVFADGETDGRPSIWCAVEKFGIDGGCANSGQHAVTREVAAKFVDGVYHFKRGKWYREE